MGPHFESLPQTPQVLLAGLLLLFMKKTLLELDKCYLVLHTIVQNFVIYSYTKEHANQTEIMDR